MTLKTRSAWRRFRADMTETQLIALLMFLFLALVGLVPVASQAENECGTDRQECPEYL